MTILGIDPGTTRIGYGLIEASGSSLRLIACGLLSSGKGASMTEAGRDLARILDSFRPAVVAIEKLFFAKNQKTGIAVAEMRGAMLMLIKERGLPVVEFSPSEIKQAVTGSGNADKKAVQKMVRLILGIPEVPGPDDVADALATAIAGASNYLFAQKTGGGAKN